MNNMLRKKLMPAEFLVASSLLLTPGIALTGYAQNTSQNSPQASPPTAAPSATPPAAPTTPPTASTTPPGASATPPGPAAASTPPGPATDQTMPGVKQGSVDDVNAVGTRDIGGRGMGNWYSTETEIRMGKSYAMQLEKSVKFVTDPTVTEYVNRIAQNLVKNSDAKVPFTIKVIDSDEVNAMALPGGFMYVNSGLILTADDEAEMAGVIAHEISHVAAHHAVREQTRMNYAQLGTIPLIFIGGWTGYGIYEAAQIGIPLTFLTFSRGFEAQADFLGVQYMYRAGYDPQAFVTIFEKLENLEKTKPNLISKAFSSHPQTPDRIEATQKEIATLLPPRAEYVVTTSEFDDVKARLARIENKRKLNDKGKGNQPTLRRASSSNSDPNAAPDSSQQGNDRPTLQRRDDN
jgi:beta-barrel assembly-enhancing protease